MRTLCTLFAVGVMLSVAASPASALLQFYKAWDEEYLTNHPDKAFVELVRKPANRCLVCHVGKNRKHHNPYGEHFEGELTKKDVRDKEKIVAAIKKIGELHVDSADDKSDTYNARIAAGKFPGGELEDLKKDPPK